MWFTPRHPRRHGSLHHRRRCAPKAKTGSEAVRQGHLPQVMRAHTQPGPHAGPSPGPGAGPSPAEHARLDFRGAYTTHLPHPLRSGLLARDLLQRRMRCLMMLQMGRMPSPRMHSPGRPRRLQRHPHRVALLLKCGHGHGHGHGLTGALRHRVPEATPQGGRHHALPTPQGGRWSPSKA